MLRGHPSPPRPPATIDSGQHLIGQPPQALISREQQSRFPAGQGQVKAVLDGMVQMAGQGQSFHLQMAVRLDLIHQIGGVRQQLLGIHARQPSTALQLQERIRHFREHQLGSQHQRRLP